MKFMTLLAISSLFIVGIYAVDDLPIAASTPDIPTVAEKKHDSTNQSTTSTEVKTTSTTSTITPTTPTTTAAPTTSTSTSTTTTTSTTTETPKTTTVAPKPEKPQLGRYYVRSNNKTCILVEFAAHVNISYGNAPKKYVSFNWPGTGEQTVEADGSCGNETTEQNILIIWPSENQDLNTLNLTFSLNATSKPKEFSLSSAVFNLSSSVVPGNTDRSVYYHVGAFFKTPKSRSYHCTRDQTLNLTVSADPESELVGNVTLTRVVMEAYRSVDTKNFSEALDCDAINTPDIVPIAVGIALIALVVVVLIAYLVGRRRAQSRGYVSM